MNKYELVFESLQKYLNSGEITLEEAEVLNEYAYDKYVEEATRLAKEIHKIYNKNPLDRNNTYTKLLKTAIDKTGQSMRSYGSHSPYGYSPTDSLGAGRRNARELSRTVPTDVNRGKYEKHCQQSVFNTKPSDSSYYDAKKSVTDDAKQRVHDDNLTYGKRRMQYLNSRHKEELAKTKNPLKKAKYKIDNKYDKESIAKDYVKREKEIEKGDFRLNYDEKNKLKEILKHRK